MEAKEVTETGSWSVNDKTDGGCANHPTWRNNPQFFLTFPSSSASGEQSIEISLTQDDTPSLHGIGFYILKSDGNPDRIV